MRHQLKERLDRLSPEQRAALAMRLSQHQPERSEPRVPLLPEIHPDAGLRYEPFGLTDIQEAYLIGRGDGVELGGHSCHTYFEVEVAGWDHARFESALQRLIDRHDMLRCIVLADGRQQVLKEVPPYQVAVEDLRGLEKDAAEARLNEVRAELSHQVLPSDRWPLFEFRVSHRDAQRGRLHVSIDLLIADARSFEIFFGELARLYRDPAAVLPPLELTFRDYQIAAGQIEGTDLYRRSRDYWLERLPQLPPAPELPLAANPVDLTRPRFTRREARLEAAPWEGLQERAGRAGLTAPGVLLAAYAEVLGVWSKHARFSLNLTLFNRLPLHPQVNDIIGDFTSVVLLEVDGGRPGTFEERAQRLQQQLWRDLEHRHFSGIRVMREISRSRGAGPQAIMPVVFTSTLNLSQEGADGSWAGGLGKQTYGVSQTPQVYLDFMAQKEDGDLVLRWDAVDKIFPDGLIDDMFEAYRHLLRQLATDDQSWQRGFDQSAWALLPEAQSVQRAKANATQGPLTDDLLHTGILKQAAERPRDLAVCAADRKLTYEDLCLRAAGVEQALLERGAAPNNLVSVIMETGWEQVVAALGILFAGAAYLPIDASWPQERRQYLVEHGESKIVLTHSCLLDRLNLPEGVEVLAVDQIEPAKGIGGPRTRQQPDDLAYVIFTSGSTGLPKGVMIDHRGALNTVLNINERFNVGPNDRVFGVSRLTFDLSVYDLFGPLATGGAVVLPDPERARDAGHWAELVDRERVTIWNSVPALVQLLVEEAGRGGPEPGASLRLILMSGDWIPVRLPSQIRDCWPAAEIVSLGGATEASIWSIAYPIEDVSPQWRSIPYGKPLRNQSFHVLNDTMAPCPVWVPGQLYIGGVGLAQGYWRDPEKTQASFIRHPSTGEWLYRTGDLGRYLPDGNIEFLGREDLQVKVQGYRIELGEIESQLLDHEAVEDAVVVVREDRPSEKRLAAYVVPKPGGEVQPGELQDYLRKKLPDYMVPSAWAFLDRLPLSANGKVDRRSLPEPSIARSGGGSDATAPRDVLEQQLTRLWEKVLHVHPVGLNDNFFDLGGHSFLAVRLFSELRNLTGRHLALSTLFRAPTVGQFAEVIRTEGWSPSWSSLVPIQPGGSHLPFYCVHGAGGNVLLFHALARHLGPEYPFYGLQARGLDGNGAYLRRVEDMAEHYIDEIRQLQPEGPYYLGGFCMGGLVAFEMAQRLVRAGHEVPFLVMIDTYNFDGVPLRKSLWDRLVYLWQKAVFHVENLAQLDPRHRRAYLAEKFKGGWERELAKVSLRFSNLFGGKPSGTGKRERQPYLEALYEEAHFTYVPTRYPGRVTLFNPSRNYYYVRLRDMGWTDLAEGGLDIIELPVNAGGMFMEPYVLTMAEKLRACLDGARTSLKTVGAGGPA